MDSLSIYFYLEAVVGTKYTDPFFPKTHYLQLDKSTYNIKWELLFCRSKNEDQELKIMNFEVEV